MKLYLRLLNYVKPYLGRAIAAVVCLALVAGLTALGFYLLKPVIDKILSNPDKEQAMFYLYLLPAALIITYFLKGLATYGQDYLINNLGNRIMMDVRNQLFQHILGRELSFFHNQRSGLLMSRITYDVNMMQAAVSNVLGRLIGSVLNIIGLISLVFYLDWKLALISLTVFPLAIYPIVHIGKSLRKISKDSQDKMADVTTVLHEALSGIRVVKAFAMEHREIERFRQELGRHFDLIMRALRKTAISSPLMEFIGVIGISGMIVVAGTHVIKGESTTGTFFAFLTGLFSLYPQVKSIAGINNTIQQALAAAVRVFEVLDEPALITDNPKAKTIHQLNDKIEFKQVSFGYQPEKLVLNDINIKAPAGGIVALVGRSGAGKTTLVDLIPRFADVTAGELLLDNTDIRDITTASLRRMIGLVTQETILFNDTIRNNIAYGKPESTLAEVEQAAKTANAHDFIMQTKNGYDTLIGERGVKLSGGQRQRLAIARAVLKNPPILILDEATSALDTESEKLIQEALEKLMTNRTTFVIAHRLSTVQHAQQILVIDNGKIVEQGRHQQLMKKDGLYKKLVRLQFGMKKKNTDVQETSAVKKKKTAARKKVKR